MRGFRWGQSPSLTTSRHPRGALHATCDPQLRGFLGGRGKNTVMIRGGTCSNPERKKDPEPGICSSSFTTAVAAVGRPHAWACDSSRVTS